MARLKPGEYEVEGIVLESLKSLDYRVQITHGPDHLIGKELLAKISGQMKMFKIKVMPGDGVKILMTRYDEKRGRITFRSKEARPLPVPPQPSAAVPAEEALTPEVKPQEETV